MAYFAQIDGSGTVVQVISVNNGVVHEPTLAFPETEPHGQAFISEVLGLAGEWKQTSYNGNFRGKYAGIGDIWDGTNFVTPMEES